jgi:hypothetical protein
MYLTEQLPLSIASTFFSYLFLNKKIDRTPSSYKRTHSASKRNDSVTKSCTHIQAERVQWCCAWSQKKSNAHTQVASAVVLAMVTKRRLLINWHDPVMCVCTHTEHQSAGARTNTHTCALACTRAHTYTHTHTHTFTSTHTHTHTRPIRSPHKHEPFVPLSRFLPHPPSPPPWQEKLTKFLRPGKIDWDFDHFFLRHHDAALHVRL